MSDKTVFEILDINLDEIFNKRELDEHLSPNRHFGIYAIVELMKQQATAKVYELTAVTLFLVFYETGQFVELMNLG